MHTTHRHPHVGIIGLASDLSLISLPREQAQGLQTLTCVVGPNSAALLIKTGRLWYSEGHVHSGLLAEWRDTGTDGQTDT